jgi:D-alanyl-D-alanine carboxypeptidase (penicillin-binding protein 5/6)
MTAHAAWVSPARDSPTRPASPRQTGFTESGGFSLVASAKRGERRVIAVVLGAQGDTARMTEAQKLLNFGFQSWETRRLYKRGDSVATPVVYKGISDTVSLGFDRDAWLTLPRERFTGVKAVLETRQPFVAPLAAGQKAGIMKLVRDSTPVAEFPVVVLEDVPVAGFLSRGWDTLKLLFLTP